MNKVNYNCKRCGKAGMAEYDPEWVSVLAKWTPMLTCNPCADYLEKLRRLKDKVYSISIDVIRCGNRNDSETLRDLRESLTLITKKIAFVVSREYRVMNEWSMDFVDQIMEQPDKSLLIVDTYEKMIRHNAQQMRQTVEPQEA